MDVHENLPGAIANRPATPVPRVELPALDDLWA
jgi:hypothetical protein